MANEFTFAYQPIVDVAQRRVVSFEALVRGPNNEPAGWVLEQYTGEALRSFDIEARQRAIELAVTLGLPCSINLNLLPDSAQIGDESAFMSTVDIARVCGLDLSRLVFEVSEMETISHFDLFVAQANLCRELGVQFAIDDFGAGYAGLNLLAQFQPDTLKLDMELVRGVESRGPRQAIVRGVIRTCEDLGIEIVAEGVESLAEYDWLNGEGIRLFQGYLFARPGFRVLPEVHFPS
ncbi:MAG TPA: EAL domain-containing protein [Thauera sp.]|nr:EAL domain-containing protein [Thauera sp.]